MITPASMTRRSKRRRKLFRSRSKNGSLLFHSISSPTRSLKQIHFVSWRVPFLRINTYLGREFLFLPTSLLKKGIDAFGNDALAPTALQDLASSKLECAKYVDHVLPLRRMCG